MEIITYTERATVIYNPDGTVKGSEAHILTGYIKEVDVPDAPGGKTLSFQVVEHDVRPVITADFEAVMNEGASLAADAAAKAGEIATLSDALDAATARAVAAEALAVEHGTTIAEQAGIIATERETATAERKALEETVRQMRDDIRSLSFQKAPTDNGAEATE